MNTEERIEIEQDLNLALGHPCERCQQWPTLKELNAALQSAEDTIKALRQEIKEAKQKAEGTRFLLKRAETRITKLEKFQNKVEEPQFSAELCEELTCINCGACAYMEERI